VLIHLEACAECRRELSARRTVQARLRDAFACALELRIDEEFAARLRAQLRSAALRESNTLTFSRSAWLSALAASLIFAAALGLVLVQRQRQAVPPVAEVQRENPQEKRMRQASPSLDARTAVNTVLAGMSRIAAGDHRNCTIEHRLPESPISLEEAGHKYDPAYINLAGAVRSRLGGSSGIEFVAAHLCVFEERRFAHVVLKHRGRLVSLLVTDCPRTAGAEGLAPAERNHQQQIIFCSEAEGYTVSCFETASHSVFIVSDLSEAENLAVARVLGPSVSAHIARAEGLA